MIVIKILGSFLLIIGAFFILSTIIGLFRMKDVYTKMHAVSVSDSLGIPLCLMGLMCFQENFINIVKIFSIIIIFFILSPANTNALISAAWQSNQKKK